jgi:murein DD-endopeptidase MepM/ murein hydrolase activator NlpD
VRTLLALPLLLALLLPPAALGAGNGGAAPGSTPAPQSHAPSGGTTPHSVKIPRGPVVESFSVSPNSTFIYGHRAQVHFVVRGGAARVHLWLVVKSGNTVARRIDLGNRRTGVRQRYLMTGLEGGPLPEGQFQLRLSARGLRGASKASATSTFSFHWHTFPLIGQFTYGVDPDGRFGAARPGHTHQGQDIPAPTGTPVVAPRGGTVKVVDYQAGGAGNYIVIHGEGENLDYVFMHLRTGSTRVKEGDRVSTGQQIGEVGSTGESTGPHLHFEIWKGLWATGGTPIDPLPFLRRWDAWS